jgi:Secretory lipase
VLARLSPGALAMTHRLALSRGLAVLRVSRNSTPSLPTRIVRALLLAAVLLLGTGAPARADYPTNDPFYAAPADLAAQAPGSVIRSRRVRLRHFAYNFPYRAYQVLYRTADRAGTPMATAATIVLPRNAPATDRKLVSYQMAYDGLSPACRPSYSLQTGAVVLQNTEEVSLGILLEHGWTVVTSDYEGSHDDWGVAATSAHGVLDGIRAAEAFGPAGLDGPRTKVGIMGYSGGGNATAWANEAAATYAPELNIVGSVQGGVAPDLDHLVRTFDGGIYAGIALAGIAGVTGAYPELDFERHLNRSGRKVFKELRSRPGSCIGAFVLRWAGVRFDSLTSTPGLLDTPELQAVAAEQGLGKQIPSTPTMWLHTTVDEMDSYRLVRSLAGRYCRAGTPVRFVSTNMVEHLMQFSWMPFMGSDWLAARFKGTPPRTDCAKIG